MDNADVTFEDDHRLVLNLIANNEVAWAYVRDEIVNPLVAANVKGMRDQLSRYSIDANSVIGKVYQGLRDRNWEAIRNFRFDCRFKSFMYWRVYDAVQRLVHEVKRPKDPILVPIDVPVDGPDGTQTGIDIQDPHPVNPAKNIMIKEAVTIANNALAELWKQNSAYVLILLMRNDLALPTHDVAQLLNRKPNTVDQMNIRAQATLRKIRDSMKSKDHGSFYPSSNL